MTQSTIDAAVQAFKRGWQPIPIMTRGKRPGDPGWTHLSWESEEDVREAFAKYAEDDKQNLGVLLGKPSGNLVDVDIDHPKASRLRDFFLPWTPMRSGRPGRPSSHYWYIVEEGTLPGTRQHLMPRDEGGSRGEVSVELRSTGAQTVLPPSIHPSGETYAWAGTPWGGEDGPAVVNGKVLAAKVAILGLGAVLLDRWPQKGTRHEAYLALAGGLLAYGDMGVHPFWEVNAPGLIKALAEATQDDDGPEQREREVIGSTMKRLRAGERVRGLGALAEIIGEQHVKQVRLMIGEVEAAAGFTSRQAPQIEDWRGAAESYASEIAAIPMDERDPLEERGSTWQPVDLDPYLAGVVKVVEPTVMQRTDGMSLMYPGRVNMLYGSSESAKSWIALFTCLQTMGNGERVVYLDFEDEPVNTLERLRALGAGDDDIRKGFAYIRPEDPIAAMQRDRWGASKVTPIGEENGLVLAKALDEIDPTLIVADGMSVIYGLHGLNTNDTVETDVITSWLKKLTRNGRATVIVIDHTTKNAERGSTPIGSQHKVSMVQGTLLQAWPVKQPMPGAVGEVELIVLKDRPGQVRKISADAGGGKAQTAAVVTMDSTVDGQTLMTVAPPQSPDTSSDGRIVDLSRSKDAARVQARADQEEAVKWAFGGVVGRAMSMRDLRDAVGHDFGNRALLNTVERLIVQGWLTKIDKVTGAPSDTATRNAAYRLEIGGSGYDDLGDD